MNWREMHRKLIWKHLNLYMEPAGSKDPFNNSIGFISAHPSGSCRPAALTHLRPKARQIFVMIRDHLAPPAAPLLRMCVCVCVSLHVCVHFMLVYHSASLIWGRPCPHGLSPVSFSLLFRGIFPLKNLLNCSKLLHRLSCRCRHFNLAFKVFNHYYGTLGHNEGNRNIKPLSAS